MQPMGTRVVPSTEVDDAIPVPDSAFRPAAPQPWGPHSNSHTIDIRLPPPTTMGCILNPLIVHSRSSFHTNPLSRKRPPTWGVNASTTHIAIENEHPKGSRSYLLSPHGTTPISTSRRPYTPQIPHLALHTVMLTYSLHYYVTMVNLGDKLGATWDGIPRVGSPCLHLRSYRGHGGPIRTAPVNRPILALPTESDRPPHSHCELPHNLAPD